MINILFVILYVIFAVTGSTLLKYGGLEQVKTIFVVPFLNLNISFLTLIGIIFYGLSFIFYTVLLNRFELSFISPLTVALVYLLLMVTAFIVFKEPINIYKIIGSSFILIGILLMVKGK